MRKRPRQCAGAVWVGRFATLLRGRYGWLRCAGVFGIGDIGAGVAAGGAVLAGGAGITGGAMRVAAGGITSFDAVLVPGWPGSWPTPKATARITTTNMAAAIHPQVEFMARSSGSKGGSRRNGSLLLR
jgi:hypothetical protein